MELQEIHSTWKVVGLLNSFYVGVRYYVENGRFLIAEAIWVES